MSNPWVWVPATGGHEPGYYNGFSIADVAWGSITWADFLLVATGWTDTDQTLISRAGSTWTVQRAGLYLIDYQASVYHGGAAAGRRYAWRMKVNGTPSRYGAQSYTDTQGRGATFHAHFSVPLVAGAQLTFEYVVSNIAAVPFTNGAMNGVTPPTVTLTINRIA